MVQQRKKNEQIHINIVSYMILSSLQCKPSKLHVFPNIKEKTHKFQIETKNKRKRKKTKIKCSLISDGGEIKRCILHDQNKLQDLTNNCRTSYREEVCFVCSPKENDCHHCQVTAKNNASCKNLSQLPAVW